MVFGGDLYYDYYDDVDEDVLKNITLISLDGGPSVPYCLQNLNPHPKQLYLSCSATLGNGKLPIHKRKSPNSHILSDSIDKIPHVCGGVTYDCDDFSCNQGLMDECYRYDPGE